MDLYIGTTNGHDFTLPPEIATQAMAVHGVRGKGKTVTATVIVEELLEQGIQVAVIDPTDSWFGLQADGTGPGYPVIVLGGEHGDLPLLEGGGAIVADFVVDHGASVVLSLRHLRKAAQKRFVRAFAEQLYHRKGEVRNRTPLFLAIDEASQFVPQRVMGDDAHLVGAIQDLVRLGRSTGIGVALIDQRPATVNKDVLTQIEILVCHAVTSPQDRKALDEWIKQKDSAGHRDAFLEHLASLPRGSAWFWYPIGDVFELVDVRMRRTFDSSKTPELGEEPSAPVHRAEVDLDALREAMAETVAEAEANDPKALKRRVAELERDLRAAKSERGLSIEEAEALAAERVAEAVRDVRARARPHVDELVHLFANGSGPPEPAAPPTAVRADPPPRRPRATMTRQTPAPRALRSGPATKLPKGERLILTAIAQHPDGVTREQLSVLTAYKRSSRDTYIQKLGAKGLLEAESGGLVVATPDGFDALGDEFEPLPVGDELRAFWLGELPQGEAAVLTVIVAAYPGSVHRDVISDATGYKRSSRDTYLQKLTARKLVEKDGPGTVRASDTLFG